MRYVPLPSRPMATRLIREVVEGGDIATAEEVDLLVVEREDHLRLARDSLQDRIRLNPADEGEDVGLDDPHLNAGPLEHRVDVLHRPSGRIHGQVDALWLDQRLQVQAELMSRSPCHSP